MRSDKWRSDIWLCVLMLAVMTVIFTLMSLWTPLRLDDNVFLYIYRGFNGGSDAFSWQALFDSWANNRLYDNARLANAMSPVSTVTAPWCTLFPFVAGAACTAMVWFTARYTGIKRNRAVALAIVWLAVVAVVPWRNCLFVRDYVLNYQFSAVIYFVFLGALCAGQGQRLRNPLWFAGTLLCGILLGGWHEGFAIPAACGMGVWALLHRLRMPWQWWVIAVGLGVSTIGFLYCPGMLKRMVMQVGKSGVQDVVKTLIDSLLPIVTLLALVAGMCRKRWREFIIERLNGQFMVIIVTSLIVGLLMSHAAMHTARMSMLSILCSIIVWGRLLHDRIENLGRTPALIISIACAMLCTAQGIAACVWQYRLKKEYDKVERMMIESPTGTAFYNIYHPSDIPKYTLYFPSRDQWVHGWCYYTFDLAQDCDIDKGCTRQHSVVPTALKHPKGHAFPESSNYYTDGTNIWCKNIPTYNTAAYSTLNIMLKDSTDLPPVVTLVERFVSLDGDTLLYIYPYQNLNPEEIHSINLISE